MEPSERWLLRVEDGVLVVEFPQGTGLSPADGEALLDRWREAAAPDAVDAIVIVVRTSRPCSDAGRRALRESAQIAVARGVDRFAVVGQRSKRRYLKRTIDVEGVDTESFNDDEAALRWAQCPSATTSSAETSS
ncbi:hypothetical protein EXE46_02170 [Halorubrum sp. GN11_10-6_MGM]|uniref:hypothetical protein n=1 Tax=Halorubrum sp. GN11_10-6_MGM TaxID=2518112 RepID=UPI0010F835D5|nr:hypothetical protein [Halorubrum sp. GN11_10-6_MGM]TKX75924.1 hypothetical protein EXE46_02170 [Halorubrum sp. GN11_10-6_MGM]